MTATRLTAHCDAHGVARDPHAGIFAVIDEDGVFACLKAEHLDAWFAGLTPELKASIYELATDGPVDEPGNVLQALSLRSGLVAHCDAVEEVIERFVGGWGALQAQPLRFDRPSAGAEGTFQGDIVESADLRLGDETSAVRAVLSEQGTRDFAALCGGEAGTHLASLRRAPVDSSEVA